MNSKTGMGMVLVVYVLGMYTLYSQLPLMLY